ncbi:MAG TPA: pitrilysin family protein [Candidatus Paceibacterota bacterium]
MKNLNRHFKFVEELSGVLHYMHKQNGLQVLLWQDKSAPVVALNVTYLVGSRNEAVGHTGSTHLLEHLMFKGSKKYNRKTGKLIDKIVFGMGAKSNATTSFDRTNYWELFPKARLSELMTLEADRMRGAILKEADKVSEMTVVRNEFERWQNNNTEVLEMEVWATAFREHPYHHPTIGWRSDIENVSIERLRSFYNDFYWPNNAYVTVAGDVEPSEALTLIDKHFGGIRKSARPIPPMHTIEPVQEGERLVTVSRAGEVPVLMLAHKVPPALASDTSALEILAGVLGKGHSSRLYRALIDAGLATSVSTRNMAFHDGGLFVTTVQIVPGKDIDQVERVVLAEYGNVIGNGITSEELEREKYNATVEQAFAKDGPLGLVSILNEAIAIGDWKIAMNYGDILGKVRGESVQAVAVKYLIPNSLTIGHFIPKQAGP